MSLSLILACLWALAANVLAMLPSRDNHWRRAYALIVLGIPLGLWAGLRPNGVAGKTIMTVSILGFSLPTFWVGLMLIMVFAVQLGWLPSNGRGETVSVLGVPLSFLTVDGIRHLILPAMTLGFIYIALIARIVRTNVIEVMGEDYIRTARAKGQTERGVMTEHALRNAAVPIVTIIGVSIAMLISGVVVTESVFNIPGLGRLVLEAVLARDYTVIQAVILLFSTIYVFINLSVDLLYGLFDPRIRY